MCFKDVLESEGMSLHDYVTPRGRLPPRNLLSVRRRPYRSSRFDDFNEGGSGRYMMTPVPRRGYRPARAPPIQEVIEYYETFPKLTPRTRSKVFSFFRGLTEKLEHFWCFFVSPLIFSSLPFSNFAHFLNVLVYIKISLAFLVENEVINLAKKV